MGLEKTSAVITNSWSSPPFVYNHGCSSSARTAA